MKIFWIDCDCSSPSHAFRLVYTEDENELYLEPRLYQCGFWKRLVYGVKYIFSGNMCRFGEFGCSLISYENAQKMIEILELKKNENKNQLILG